MISFMYAFAGLQLIKMLNFSAVAESQSEVECYNTLKIIPIDDNLLYWNKCSSISTV